LQHMHKRSNRHCSLKDGGIIGVLALNSLGILSLAEKIIIGIYHCIWLFYITVHEY
jgi:hypothetical protein